MICKLSCMLGNISCNLVNGLEVFFGIRSCLVFRVTVLLLFSVSTVMAASDSAGADGRASMQDWKSFPEFLREGHWNLLQSAEERQLKKSASCKNLRAKKNHRGPRKEEV